MGWVYQAPWSAVCSCERPPITADIRLDDLWRCDECRMLWRVARACDLCDLIGGQHQSGQHAVGWKWRPARWWQRLRHLGRR